MRPYRNVTDSELEALGAVYGWSKEALLSLTLPAKVLWIHSSRERFHRLDLNSSSHVRVITIQTIQGDVIKTDFGSYSLHTGKNLFHPAGTRAFYDCYGQLYLLKNSIRY